MWNIPVTEYHIQLKLSPILRDFSLFLAKFALEPCNQKCLLQIGRPQRLPVISNHIPVVSRSNAFMAI